MKEEFRDIKDYEGLYQVSNFGRVKSLERMMWNGKGWYHRKEIILKFGDTGDDRGNGCPGYNVVNLLKNGIQIQFRVHRLVAEAFILNSENKPYVNHKNSNRKDNRVENLEWVTPKENSDDAHNRNCTPKGEECSYSKLKEPQVIEILYKYATGNYTQQQLADEYNVSRRNIGKIINGKTWKHIKRTPPIGSPLKKPNI